MDSGSISLTTGSDTTIFDAAADGGPCTTYAVTNTDSVNNAMIKVSGLHSSYFPVGPGQTIPFRLGDNGLTKIVGRSSAGSVVVAGGVESRL